MARYKSLDSSLCFRDGSSFIRKSIPGGGLAYLRAGRDCPGLRAALENPDSLFDSASAILKDSRSSKVALSTIDGLGDVFVKRHNNKGLRYVLRHFFRKARSFRNWQAAWLLEQLDVPTPLPIAAIAFRKAFIIRGSYLVTERVNGLLSASDFVPKLYENDAGFDAFLAEVFKHLSLMHDCGISHGDLKFSNLAAVYAPSGSMAFAGFIDLDSLKRRSSSLPLEAKAFELARMAASLIAIISGSGASIDLAACCERLSRLYESSGGSAIPPSKIQELSKLWLDRR